MTVGFDSKDFIRTKALGDHKIIQFYSPLGIGVKTKNLTKLRLKLIKETKSLNKSFGNSKPKVVECSRPLVDEIGHRKATPFLDQLVKNLEDLIESIFVTYVILPPKTVPTVNVGGYQCQEKTLKTMDFLRRMATYFSYITAWCYCGRHKNEDELLVDNFSGKETMAWEDLKQEKFTVYPRGDECQELISLADTIAYLTDKKLWDSKKWLRVDAIEEIWDSYDFDVEVRYIDQNLLSKIKWYNNKQIDQRQYLARPIVFLDLDELNMKKLSQANAYCDLVNYAVYKKGGIQGFDINVDFNKIKNGDVYVFAGENARKRADTFSDMYDIEICSVKELPKKVKAYSP